MSNPFDDLKADDEGSAASDAATEPDSQPESPEPEDGDPAAEMPTSNPADELITEPESELETTETTSDESVSPAETGPAFEYSEVQQKPFYARAETVTEFENQIRTTIVPTLAEAGVLDEESREIHDAILRLANEQPERVAELVLEERRQAGSQ
ncbi:hypothetical protein ACFR99_02920 [Haloarchaeobius amylolyticus]|uniref:Uncharacterized protein n=1 Tax=Haloarchaeobius amylolyticus TaxID=1198296 RepID=A0ABD6BCR2_9EURY